jgi:hypothetical protein
MLQSNAERKVPGLAGSEGAASRPVPPERRLAPRLAASPQVWAAENTKTIRR